MPRSELGFPPAIPVFYIVGASAVAGAATAYAWLTREEWTTEYYNEQMTRMKESMLLWDGLGWNTPSKGKSACWYKNQTKRAEWKSFIERFGKFYHRYGVQKVYLPDGIEKSAREFVSELAAWSEWLEKSCGIGVVKPKPEDEPMDFGSMLKWGALIVGGIVALQVISGVRDATASRRRY